MNNEIELSVKKVKRNKKIMRAAKMMLLLLLLLLLAIYFVVGLVYQGGKFGITLDKDLYLKNKIIIYDDPDYKVFRSELFPKTVETFSPVTAKWFPNDLDNYDGSHNGDNYIAYTFYIENLGDKTADYWAELVIDRAVKKLDEAIRIRVYRNGEQITYAKKSMTGAPEPNTVAFQDDKVVFMEEVKDFGPKDKNKYTLIIWLEGKDPECTNNLIGGEIKFNMAFNSENIRDAKQKSKTR